MPHPERKDMDDLVSSAYASFQILEPWCNARVGDASRSRGGGITGQLDQFLGRIQAQAHKYFHTIEISIDCSQAGLNICSDSLNLYHKVVVENKSPQGLIDFVDLMQKRAHKAHKRAEDMEAAFKAVQWEFVAISDDISPLLKEIEEALESFDRSPHWAEKIANVAAAVRRQIPKDFGLKFAVTAAAGMAPMAAAIPFGPIILFILPVAIPLMMLAVGSAAEGVEKFFRSRNERKNMIKIGSTGTKSQLEGAQKTLSELARHIGAFVGWWSHIKEDIDDLKRALEDGSIAEARARMEAAKPHWVHLESLYRDYILEIEKLQAFYPASYQKSRVQ